MVRFGKIYTAGKETVRFLRFFLGIVCFFLGYFIGNQEEMTAHLLDWEVWSALLMVAFFGSFNFRYREDGGGYQVYKTTLFPFVWVMGSAVGFSFGPDDPGKDQALVVFLGLTILFVPATAITSVILAAIKEAFLSIQEQERG